MNAAAAVLLDTDIQATVSIHALGHGVREIL